VSRVKGQQRENTMTTSSFDDYLEHEGQFIWSASARVRSQTYHGARPCPARKPSALTKGSTICADCESLWAETALALWKSGKGLTRVAVRSATLDAVRSSRVKLGMAARPGRDLQTAKWAEPLRSIPWIVPVLTELAYFASSRDECATEWPYERISERVSDLPSEGVEYAVKVAIAAVDLIRPKWADANLHRPAGRRITSHHLEIDDST